jgi:FkbH-like protein
VRIGLEEIISFVDLRQPFDIELAPNDEAGERETTLYFGLMDFVKEAKTSLPSKNGKDKSKAIKCVVWDLDHTLWDGILVEDGVEKLRLKPGIAEVIQSLDQRGILHSVASKNNLDEALAAIRQFQLSEYFLYPQISWQPKSQAIKRIAQQLNIGLDSLLFVDDSLFELEEVKTVCPEVRTLNSLHYREIAEMKECQVPVTEESRERRKMYQVEMSRQGMAESFGDDYMQFLRHCEIRLSIKPMTEENLERVHELTQRTNQMNFSGNRYDREVLREILGNPDLETYVLSCEDRFGSYGVIGFSLVNRREPRMTDLMFSCRVQSKRVEHAFLTYVMRKFVAETGGDFYANYRKTPRNAPSGKVFEDMGMEEVGVKDGVSSLVFRRGREVPDDGVIEIVVQEQVLA